MHNQGPPLVRVACTPCRALKAKCDGEEPCHRCARRGDTCTYEERKITGRRATHFKSVMTVAEALGPTTGIFSMFIGEPLRASEVGFLNKFFEQAQPCLPCVTRRLVDEVINARARLTSEPSPQDGLPAANHMLIYGLIAIGAQLYRETATTMRYMSLAVQGLPHVMEHPTPNGLIALCVITYFYFGTKRKSALACHAMSLTHIAYLLRRKRVTLDPLLNQTLLFFEKIVLLKIQKAREAYRLPTPEEVSPISLFPIIDPDAVCAVLGRIGDICVHLTCVIIGLRKEEFLDAESAAVVQQLLGEADSHVCALQAASPSATPVHTLALLCGLKAVFLRKCVQEEESMVCAKNMANMLTSSRKPNHCFLAVIVVSSVLKALKPSDPALNSTLLKYLSDLGRVWPVAERYCQKTKGEPEPAAGLSLPDGDDGTAPALFDTSLERLDTTTLSRFAREASAAVNVTVTRDPPVAVTRPTLKPTKPRKRSGAELPAILSRARVRLESPRQAKSKLQLQREAQPAPSPPQSSMRSPPKVSPVKVARAEMPVPPAPSTGPAESTASPVPSLLFDSDADEYFDDLLVFLDGLEDETAEPEC